SAIASSTSGRAPEGPRTLAARPAPGCAPGGRSTTCGSTHGPRWHHNKSTPGFPAVRLQVSRDTPAATARSHSRSRAAHIRDNRPASCVFTVLAPLKDAAHQSAVLDLFAAQVQFAAYL